MKVGKHESAADAHLSPNEDWLNTQTEDILEPELEIIDAHHHLWDPPGRRYLLEEFVRDLQTGHMIRGTVFAECHAMYRADGPADFQPVGEVEFANGIAAQSASGAYGPTQVCAGIIGGLDWTSSALDDVLEAEERAGGGRFRGVRCRTAWHASEEVRTLPTAEGTLSDARFRAMARRLQARRLILDIWAFHTQLEEVISLSRALPDLTVVLDHLGGPVRIGPYAGKRDEVFADWSGRLRQLAELPNVYLKIGGLGMRFGGFDFHKEARAPSSTELAAAWKPYVETAIEAFEPSRSMFESNFPVDKAMFSYPVLWNAFKRLTADLSVAERRALFSGTAEKVYSLAA